MKQPNAPRCLMGTLQQCCHLFLQGPIGATSSAHRIDTNALAKIIGGVRGFMGMNDLVSAIDSARAMSKSKNPDPFLHKLGKAQLAADGTYATLESLSFLAGSNVLKMSRQTALREHRAGKLNRASGYSWSIFMILDLIKLAREHDNDRKEFRKRRRAGENLQDLRQEYRARAKARSWRRLYDIFWLPIGVNQAFVKGFLTPELAGILSLLAQATKITGYWRELKATATSTGQNISSGPSAPLAARAISVPASTKRSRTHGSKTRMGASTDSSSTTSSSLSHDSRYHAGRSMSTRRKVHDSKRDDTPARTRTDRPRKKVRERSDSLPQPRHEVARAHHMHRRHDSRGSARGSAYAESYGSFDGSPHGSAHGSGGS